jgi:acyl carrier protein
MLGTRMYVDTNKYEFDDCIQKIIDEILSLESNNNTNTSSNKYIYQIKSLNLFFLFLIIR